MVSIALAPATLVRCVFSSPRVFETWAFPGLFAEEGEFHSKGEKKDFVPSTGLTTEGAFSWDARGGPPCQPFDCLCHGNAAADAAPWLRSCLLSRCRGRPVAPAMGPERAGGEDHAIVAHLRDAGRFGG